MKNKKEIIKGIIIGVIISILTIIILTSPLPTKIKAQTTATSSYMVFKTPLQGFKFFKQVGRMPKEYAPIFAQTPDKNSDPNQVATKEYVDSRTGSAAFPIIY